MKTKGHPTQPKKSNNKRKMTCIGFDPILNDLAKTIILSDNFHQFSYFKTLSHHHWNFSPELFQWFARADTRGVKQGQTRSNKVKQGQTWSNGTKWDQTVPNILNWGQTWATLAKLCLTRPNGAKQGHLAYHPLVGGWPSLGWWVILLQMVSNHPWQLSPGVSLISNV